MKAGIASSIANEAGVEDGDVIITASSGSIRITADILTTSNTPAAITSALSSAFASVPALSELLGPSITVQAIESPPENVVRLIFVNASPPAPPPAAPTSLSTLQSITYIGAPALGALLLLVLATFVACKFHSRRKKRRASFWTADGDVENAKAPATEPGAESQQPRDTAERRLIMAAAKAKEERVKAEREAAAKLEAEKAAAVQATADKLFAEQATAAMAVAEKKKAAKAAAEKAEEARLEAERLEEERMEAERLAAEMEAEEQRRRETEKFWSGTGSPDHQSLPKLMTSTTRNGVNDARAELEKLWLFVGMSPRATDRGGPTERTNRTDQTDRPVGTDRRSQTQPRLQPTTPPPMLSELAEDPYTV